VRMRMVLVANPQHPLHALGRDLTMQDLRAHRHLLIRESGSSRTTRPLIESTQRWTVGHMATSIQAALKGFGYAWFPEEKIRDEFAAGYHPLTGRVASRVAMHRPKHAHFIGIVAERR